MTQKKEGKKGKGKTRVYYCSETRVSSPRSATPTKITLEKQSDEKQTKKDNQNENKKAYMKKQLIPVLMLCTSWPRTRRCIAWVGVN